MILIDSRVGSGELLPMFSKGVARCATLPFGDFCFTGNGPGGMPLNIGIERKQVREIAGTLADGRLVGHQLPGMLREYHVVYLVVEGRWRGAPGSGILQVKKGEWRDVENGSARFLADTIRKFLSTLENMAGVRLRYTEDKKGTVQEVEALYSWWVEKEWSEHDSHLAIQFPQVETVMLHKPSVMRRMAACLPGIGWKRSGAVEAHFQNIIDMVCGETDEWMEVEGVGKETARKVVDTLQKGRG